MSTFDQDAVTDQHREEGKHLAALVTAKDTPNYRRVLRDNEAFLARWICDQEKKTGLERSESNGATSGSHHNTPVRELEWKPSDVPGEEHLIIAITPVGVYRIWDYHTSSARCPYQWKRNKGTYHASDSLEEAKAACQSDFQKRVNECLAEPKATGWRDIESAPRDGTAVLMFNIRWKLPYAAKWLPHVGHDGCPWVSALVDHSWPDEAFSHWHPLPPPPGQEDDLGSTDTIEALRAENAELRARYDKLASLARTEALPALDATGVNVSLAADLRSALSPKEGE